MPSKLTVLCPSTFERDDDPADSIIRQTPGMRGVDAVIDAVGFEAKGQHCRNGDDGPED